jgi:hypothetical protein
MRLPKIETLDLRKPEILEKERSNYKSLSQKELHSLLFLSFMFSQGDAAEQIEILKYSACFYGPQHISDEIKKNLIALLDKNIKRLVMTGTHGKQSITDDYEGYFRILADGDWPLINHRSFAEFLINKDLGYYKNGGRPDRKSENDGDNSMADKFKSFVVNYLIRGNKTGDKSIDDLINKTREYLSFLNEFPIKLPENFFTDRMRADVSFIHSVVIYNKENPEHKIEDSYRYIYFSFLELIREYNFRHPKTPVSDEELKNVGIVINK